LLLAQRPRDQMAVDALDGQARQRDAIWWTLVHHSEAISKRLLTTEPNIR
jgi:hypothetical protein